MIKKRKNKNEGGFSFMEVMVAIYIILTALVAIMSLVGSTTASASASISKLVAANLAQEGMEIVKNIRDLSYVSSTGWNDWYKYNAITGTTCYFVQYNDIALEGRNEINCADDAPILKFDVASGLYGYDGVADAPFQYKRKITLTPWTQDIGGNTVEIKVSVRVDWAEHNRPQSLTVEDQLWNWR